jgi:acyl carrier protein
MASTLTIAPLVHKIIAENIGVELDRVADEAKLFDLGADSLDIIELAMTIEQELGVELREDCEADWRTVGDVVRSVEAVRS